ncbi:MAG: hypothetical protein JWM73_2251, partial [Solirubrobacterales bacterium]|nr:hypothetical protein [Solirubrobacterales bacterium]
MGMPRRLLLFSLASLAVALPAATASATSCPGADTTISALTAGSARAAVLCVVNAERTARGLDALTLNTKLQLAAQRHSEDMLARGYFAHEAPAPAAFGADPGDRIDAAGYDWQSYGENIAAGYGTPREVMEAWMASEGHCHNILDPGFTELGVGVTALAATIDGELGTWTQDFGRPRGASAPGSNHGPQGACPYGALQGLDSPEPAAAPGSDQAPALPTAGETPAPAGDEPARDAS